VRKQKIERVESQDSVRVQIYFSPGDLTTVESDPDDVYIVIDVVRATTTLAVLFDSHISRVYAANTLEQAQNAAKRYPSRLFAGERHARPLPGFDYGNSPAQFSELDLSGRELILTTTNGTRAFHACPFQSTRLAGCFYNAHAVTSHALAVAQERNSNVIIVCAAESNYFALDDATCAGYLALELQRQHPTITVSDDVYAGIALYNTYAPPKLTDYANSARSIREADMERDLDFCMKIDGSKAIPMVVGVEVETGLLVIENVGA
jgi:2-phosphosulfolactate phosphatase